MVDCKRIVAILLLATAFVVAGPRPAAFSATWVEGSLERRVFLAAMLTGSDYDRLEAELTEQQQRYEAGQISDAEVGHDYFTFWSSNGAFEPRLREWLERKPDSYAARLALGAYYVHLGWVSRGARFASETDPSQFHLMHDYFDRARSHLELALRLNNRLMFAYSALSDSEMARSDKKEMARLIEAGLTMDPLSRTMHRDRLQGLQRRWGGSIPKMRQYLLAHRKAFEEHSDLRSLRGWPDFDEGQDLMDAGDYAGAVAAFTKALAYGEDGTFRHYRGNALLRLRRYDEAIADQKQAAPRLGNPARAFLQIAYARASQRDHAGAALDWNRAVESDPRNPDILISRARHLAFMQETDKALADLAAAMEFGSFDPQLFLQRRLLMHTSSRYQEALGDAERAVALAPRNSKAWMAYAEALTFVQDCRAREAYARFQSMCAAQGTCDDTKTRAFPSLMSHMSCDAAGGRSSPQK